MELLTQLSKQYAHTFEIRIGLDTHTDAHKTPLKVSLWSQLYFVELVVPSLLYLRILSKAIGDGQCTLYSVR